MNSSAIIEKNIQKTLRLFAIGDYIKNRIKAHNIIYNDIITYKNNQDQDILFSLLCFILLRHLQDGNTFFWFDDSNMLKNNNTSYQSSYWGIDFLASWQCAILAAILPIFDESLGRTYTEFGNIIKVWLSSNNSTNLLNEFTENIKKETRFLGENNSNQLADLLKKLLYFCNICVRFKSNNLYDFYCFIKDSFFCQNSSNQNNNSSNTSFFVISDFFSKLNHDIDNNINSSVKSGFGIWLYRSWFAEYSLANYIHHLIMPKPQAIWKKFAQQLISQQQINGDNIMLNTAQKKAINAVLANQFVIITGGPGTGKTFTIGQLVGQLVGQLLKNPHQHIQPLSLALVAPTGKAAKRMQESLQVAIGNDTIILPEAKTIHRLLGVNAQGVFKYHQYNRLPYDLIIIDESSMLGVELAEKLFASIGDNSTLVLLGDANQLSAVDSGAVLSDLCRIKGLQNHQIILNESRRFHKQSAIGQLAELIKQNHEKIIKIDKFMHLMEKNNNLFYFQTNNIEKKILYQKLVSPYKKYFQHCKQLSLQNLSTETKKQAIKELFNYLNEYRILTASHQGILGDIAINKHISFAHLATQHQYNYSNNQQLLWYHGRVVMVSQNNYELALFNGDIGICVDDGDLVVYFDGKDESIPAAILDENIVTTAYAMTIYKSQGSEFNHVAICFDDSNEKLLGQELLYTAVTRAKKQVNLYSTNTAISKAINCPTQRKTGLELIFTQQSNSNYATNKDKKS